MNHRYRILLTMFSVAALAGACTDECERALDCASDQVCLRGICTQAQSSAATCQSSMDCGGAPCVNGVCRAGGVVSQPTPDSGMPDSGSTSTPVDSGVPPRDAGEGPPRDAGEVSSDAGSNPGAGTISGTFSVGAMTSTRTFSPVTVTIANAASAQLLGNQVGGGAGDIFVMRFPPAAGVYNCTLNTTAVTYTAGGVTYRAASTVGNTSCTVTVTGWGMIGQPVTGTFSGSLVNTTNQNETLQISNGTFNATR